jgi:hypothetical protein
MQAEAVAPAIPRDLAVQVTEVEMEETHLVVHRLVILVHMGLAVQEVMVLAAQHRQLIVLQVRMVYLFFFTALRYDFLY